MSDLISRQAAIDAVNTALFPKINTAKDAEKALKSLPSAEPERKCGTWIKLATPISKNNWYCSECGNGIVYRDHYCPNCGAYMR